VQYSAERLTDWTYLPSFDVKLFDDKNQTSQHRRNSMNMYRLVIHLFSDTEQAIKGPKRRTLEQDT
jgi:hypothetical protein